MSILALFNLNNETTITYKSPCHYKCKICLRNPGDEGSRKKLNCNQPFTAAFGMGIWYGYLVLVFGMGIWYGYLV